MPIKSSHNTGANGPGTKKPSLDELLAHIDRLPQPPQVALKLTQIIESKSVSAEQIGQVLQMDTTLTAQVLRLCNSSVYGLSRRIETIKEAIAMLGFGVIKSMAFTIISQNSLDRPVQGYDLGKGALWANAATCAVYARHIAKTFKLADPDVAYTGALLRDIGKLVLDRYVGQFFVDIEQYAIEGELHFEQAEARTLGYSHTEVGEKVAQAWNLPESLRAVIRYHHQPSAMPEDLEPASMALVAVVHLADIMTMMAGCGVGSDGLMYTLDEPGLVRAGLSVDSYQLERLFAELLDQGQQVRELLESFGVGQQG
jgi:putative nucleotidyltransferase with HDIG domain